MLRKRIAVKPIIKPKQRQRFRDIYKGSADNFGAAIEAYSQIPEGRAKIALIIVESKPALKRPQTESFVGNTKTRIGKEFKRTVVQLTRPALKKQERKRIDSARRRISIKRRDSEFVPKGITGN